MLGAISGDVIGSVYEFSPVKDTDFPLFTSHSSFTDDTVLTIAIADSLIHKTDLTKTLKAYTRQYPTRGYGGSYSHWAFSDKSEPYNSWGNGSAMRTSPIGFFFNNEKQVLSAAKEYAAVTHNHRHGIIGAQAVSLAIFMARMGAQKKDIRREISQRFKYNLKPSISEIRPSYTFDVSCQGSVPQSIISFLESEGVEDAIRLAVSLGGDADTMACISGGIAEAFYGEVPSTIEKKVRGLLPEGFLSVIDEFYKTINN